MDIYSIPLYYISFNEHKDLYNDLNSIGFKNINHFKAIDGRKFKIDDLIENNMISIRSYNDLMFKRETHSGLSSLGAVGCTLSHLGLWKKCINENLPFIIICEDDININKPMNALDETNIINAISKENGIFVSSNINYNKEFIFIGLQFYILSQGACKQLVKYALPIDVQTDHYISNLHQRNKVKISGYEIYNQKSHKSSIQDICIKCILPKHILYYIFIILIIILILFILFRKNNICKINLKECRSKI